MESNGAFGSQGGLSGLQQDFAESYRHLFPAGKVVRRADSRRRILCQLALYIWHAMSGKPPRLPRQRDLHFSLFMKLRNLEVEIVGENDCPTVCPTLSISQFRLNCHLSQILDH